MPEYVTEKPVTVCKRCRWFELDEGRRWSKALCMFEEECWSVVTGKPFNPGWCYCIERNDGNCPHFEPKGTP